MINRSVISGIVRLSQSTITHDQIIDWASDMFWVDIHLGVALLCASLPTYRPLVRSSFSYISSSIRSYGSRNGSVQIGDSRKGSYAPFNDDHIQVPEKTATVGNMKFEKQVAGSYKPRVGTIPEARESVVDNAMPGIRVERTVDVVAGRKNSST